MGRVITLDKSKNIKIEWKIVEEKRSAVVKIGDLALMKNLNDGQMIHTSTIDDAVDNWVCNEIETGWSWE